MLVPPPRHPSLLGFRPLCRHSLLTVLQTSQMQQGSPSALAVPHPPAGSPISASSATRHHTLEPGTWVSLRTSLFPSPSTFSHRGAGWGLIRTPVLVLKPVLLSPLQSCHRVLVNQQKRAPALAPVDPLSMSQSQGPFHKETLVMSPLCFQPSSDSPFLSSSY